MPLILTLTLKRTINEQILWTLQANKFDQLDQMDQFQEILIFVDAWENLISLKNITDVTGSQSILLKENWRNKHDCCVPGSCVLPWLFFSPLGLLGSSCRHFSKPHDLQPQICNSAPYPLNVSHVIYSIAPDQFRHDFMAKIQQRCLFSWFAYS